MNIRLKKKKSGMVDKLLPLLMCLVVVALIMHVLIGWIATINAKDNVDFIVREYMLQMEADGYLTPENKVALEQALNDVGMTVSEWGTTTFSEVGYGTKITLEIYGKMKDQTFIITAWDSIQKSDQLLDVHIKRSSTAKN